MSGFGALCLRILFCFHTLHYVMWNMQNADNVKLNGYAPVFKRCRFLENVLIISEKANCLIDSLLFLFVWKVSTKQHNNSSFLQLILEFSWFQVGTYYYEKVNFLASLSRTWSTQISALVLLVEFFYVEKFLTVLNNSIVKTENIVFRLFTLII